VLHPEAKSLEGGTHARRRRSAYPSNRPVMLHLEAKSLDGIQVAHERLMSSLDGDVHKGKTVSADGF
jgi:hypothetical protein